MRLIAAGILASFAIAVPASGQTVTPSAPEAKEAKPEKAKRVCRSIPVTGQRIPRRECKTAAEWSTTDALRDSTEAMRVKSVGPVGG